MLTEIDALPAAATGRHLVFEATLRPNYLAPSYFPAGVLNANGLYLVGSRPARAEKVTARKTEADQPTRTLLLAGDPQAVHGLASQVATAPSTSTEREWDEYRRFISLSLPAKENVIVRRPPAGTSTSVTFEAVLTHVFSAMHVEPEWADFHFKKFVAWVNQRGGVVDEGYRRDLRGLTFVPVLAPPDALDSIAGFNLLRAIRPMPQIAPFPEAIFRIARKSPKPSVMAEDGELPNDVTAVFDGGVDPTLPPFAPFVQAFDLSGQPPDRGAVGHGSMVTSALLYGHVDPDAERLPDPVTRVDHYRVFPLPASTPGRPDHSLYEMLDRIVGTLRGSEYSLVALAIGPNEALEDAAEPDRFTSELDALAVDEGITFVTAVGNNGELDSALGLDRVQPPGDMVNGIGVGACTRQEQHPKQRYHAAPYSARGPGREGQRVQPTIVEFGGSTEQAFVGFDAQGRLAESMGTSFASPSAARGIANLRNLLTDAHHRPEILRAFSVHFAQRGWGHGKRFLDLGYGRIAHDFVKSFDCPENEVTVLYEDHLERGGSVGLTFPFPVDLPPDTPCELSWTLSYLSEVDPRDATDYTLSGIETIFRPHFYVRTLTEQSTRKGREVRVDLEREAIEEAIASGAFSLSVEPKAHSAWLPTRGEQRLRRDGKWETLLPGRVKLPASDLLEPRLDLLYLRREGGQLIAGQHVKPLRFAMLLTLRALNGASIYDRVRSQYSVLAPLATVPVQVRGHGIG